MLNVLEYKNNDKVLFLYYPKERFLKYSKDIPLNDNTSHVSKYDFLFIKSPNEVMENTFKDGKKTYKAVFNSDKTKGLDEFLNKNVYYKISNGDKFFLVDFSPVSIF